MMKIKSSLYCLTMLLTLTAQVAVARPSILAAWQSAYPASDSDLVNCQLCHQNTSGGNPWNAYGWNIRQGIQNSGLAASAAIAAIEGNNSDASVVSASNNLEEISANTQPGWTARGCQYHLLQKRLYTHQPIGALAGNCPRSSRDCHRSHFIGVACLAGVESGVGWHVQAIKPPY